MILTLLRTLCYKKVNALLCTHAKYGSCKVLAVYSVSGGLKNQSIEVHRPSHWALQIHFLWNRPRTDLGACTECTSSYYYGTQHCAEWIRALCDFAKWDVQPDSANRPRMMTQSNGIESVHLVQLTYQQGVFRDVSVAGCQLVCE